MSKPQSKVIDSLQSTNSEIIKKVNSATNLGFQDKSIILKSTERKIKDTPDAYRLFLDEWNKIILICSIRQLPETPIVQLIFNTIKDDYPQLSLSEITYAFLLNQKRSLNEYHESYGILDLKFVCAVLLDYISIRNTAFQNLQKYLPAMEPKTDTPEEQYLYLVDFYTKNGDFPDYFSYPKVYSYMDETGMIPETNDEKKKLYEIVKHRLEQGVKLKELGLSNTVSRSMVWDGFEDNVKNECRKITVQKYIVKFVESQSQD